MKLTSLSFILLIGISGLVRGQDSLMTRVLPPAKHTVFVGIQAPLNYTAGYRFQINRRFSVQAQGGVIAAPFDRYTLKMLEGFGLDPNLSRVIDRGEYSCQFALVRRCFCTIRPLFGWANHTG